MKKQIDIADCKSILSLILDKKLKNYASFDPDIVWEYTYWDDLEEKIRSDIIDLNVSQQVKETE
jgi:hypothetical protein